MPHTETKPVPVTLSNNAYRLLKARALRTMVTATVASRRASTQMTIRKR